MSWVTSLMLHISAVEEIDSLLPGINEFFKSYPNSVDGRQQTDEGLTAISQLVPGGKVFGAQVFFGAYNYFPVDKFLSHLRSLRWEEPELSQLFVLDEEDLSFRSHFIGNHEAT